MTRPLAHCGTSATVSFAVMLDGKSPGFEFLVKLEARDKKKYLRLVHLFQWLGDKGRIHNKEKFKQIENTEFFEFKVHQIRMPCFRENSEFIITHGFIKKQDKIRPEELEIARRIMNEDRQRHARQFRSSAGRPKRGRDGKTEESC